MSATAAIPIRRRHRTDLPGPWRDYLAHGALPLIRVDDPEHPRSNYEATATAVLLRHGYDADEAWRTIQAAHPSAFTKTRKQGHSWWVKYVWNKAVADDDTFIPVGTAQIDPALAGAIHAAQDALEDLAWRLPARQRPALLLVGHAVLDRMSRVGALRVPVPERDLVLDTGLSDRKTIRAQLRLLHGPLGTLHTEVWDPIHKRDTSSFEFEVPPVEGVGEIPHLAFTPPSPAAAGRPSPDPATNSGGPYESPPIRSPPRSWSFKPSSPTIGAAHPARTRFARHASRCALSRRPAWPSVARKAPGSRRRVPRGSTSSSLVRSSIRARNTSKPNGLPIAAAGVAPGTSRERRPTRHSVPAK